LLCLQGYEMALLIEGGDRLSIVGEVQLVGVLM